ncbi:hypothetical protein EMIHUDRAFT_231903 [Emiliania huxleyi CCMP1516]|uniref:Uncharacterized protein n=2 Tax=Emiliania huxleyi TaxID=2903 RepID=A0A0D3K6W1_EMIH1|nr:hypothetical protein EMIHUDRAFT_231903 [Emiliania huxleyi CCMP1516]EOD31496.1 hypothetical protein EMIHUDRAFT_231903 [Emiliania huxleyi CCMP1516]|eukprot:XP_005783925.1 hypothetical protein EMIHUDRAFT_231903 [Emiliania huxleyi CCMP1516]
MRGYNRTGEWPEPILTSPAPQRREENSEVYACEGDASRATGTSVATVTTSLAAVELCDEDVAMRCSAQSDAGSAADPEWEAVLAQLLAEEAEEEELCCRFERRGDDSDDGWDNYSEEEEEDAVQGVAGKVDESLERRDERACATGLEPRLHLGLDRADAAVLMQAGPAVLFRAAEVEAEKRAKGKKGKKKKKKGGGSGGAGPSQESEAPAEAAAAKPAPLDREGLLKLLAELHEDRIRFGITPETSGQGAGGGLARAQGQLAQW